MVLQATVSGRVQGVGFRYYVYEAARALGLTGITRNQPDGSVWVEAQGPEEDLQELEQKLWKGPFLSHVTDVKCVYLDEIRDLPPFQIGR